MKNLLVHVDESGQFSLNKETSEYYIIGMVFHEEIPDPLSMSRKNYRNRN